MLCSNCQVADEDNFKSAADGHAVHRGNDRLVQIEALGQAGKVGGGKIISASCTADLKI